MAANIVKGIDANNAPNFPMNMFVYVKFRYQADKVMMIVQSI